MLIPVWDLGAAEVYAASLSLGINGLVATYDGGDWTASGTTINGSATGKAAGTCSGASSVIAKLTLENNRGEAAKLSFNYSRPIIGSGGHVLINGTAVTSAGSFDIELANNESVIIEILSGKEGAITSSVELTDIQFVIHKEVTTIFEPAEAGGAYSVDGNNINTRFESTRLSTEAYSLSAIPEEGYKFFGWKSSSNGIISNNANYSCMFETSQTITAVFLKNTDPVFQVGSEWFTDLNEANNYATSQNISKIVLISDGVLSAGKYSVSNGNTLLIPYENSYSVNTIEPAIEASKAPSAPTVYKKLMLASGAELTIDGDLCVNARVNSYNNNYTGVTTGKFGQVHMYSGSNITVNNNANLYCWGYITGAGSIIAESGSNVYEPFQICDIRGGTATSSMNGNKQKVLPFSQYYVQNIEVPLTIKYGATEQAVGFVTIQGSTAKPKAKFIGSSGALFSLSPGGSFTKAYDPKQDRVTYDVEGNSSVNGVSLSAYITINTSDYVLPIMENTTINIHSGTTIVNQDLCMIPGSVINVDAGATVKTTSGKNVYIYDRDQWKDGKYLYPNKDFVLTYYQPSRDNADKFSDADLVDAKINVNGTVDLEGKMYTTDSGADITSSEETGRFLFSSSPTETGTTYQAVQTGTSIEYIPIPVTSPQLHNKITEPEYTQTAGTAAGGYYSFCAIHGKWELGDPHEATFKLKKWQWTEDFSKAEATFECEQDGHIVIKDAAVTSNVISAPTCTDNGTTEYTATVTMEGETYTDVQTAKSEPIGHSYGEPTYKWSEDNKTVTATMVCANDANHVVTEEAETTYTVTKEAGCETKGVGTYTVSFENEAFETQTKTVEIAATGHSYGAPTYEWSEDNKTVTATMVCDNDATHVVTEETETTYKVTIEPTSESAGEGTYTAAFENSGFETQTRKVEIPRCDPSSTPDTDHNKINDNTIDTGTSAALVEGAIKSMKSDKDLKGSKFSRLKLKSSKQSKTSITIKWNKVKKAERYVIYANKCGKKNKPKKLATVKGKNSWILKRAAGKKLKKGTYYKMLVVALDENGRVISTSKLIHVATRGGKVGNHKSILIKKPAISKGKSLKLKKGRRFKIRAIAVPQSRKLKVKKHVGIRYETTNKKIATISNKGVIKAKAKGTCCVYVYAQNGIYKKIKIKVR